MLISRQAIIKALADLTSSLFVVVKLAAMFTTFVATFVLTCCLGWALFPHMSGPASAVLGVIAFPLTAIGVCKLTFLCGSWPWYDTLIAALWIAWEADGYRGHVWSPEILVVTSVLVLCAVLRWVPYALRRGQASGVTTIVL